MSGQPTADLAQGDAMPVSAMQANSSVPEPTRPKRASWERTCLLGKDHLPHLVTNKYCQLRKTLISHASKVLLRILQTRLQRYMNCGLPDVQAGFRKGRGTRGQIANIRWVIKKAREKKKKQESSRKTSTFALLTMPKPLTVWITAVENS